MNFEKISFTIGWKPGVWDVSCGALHDLDDDDDDDERDLAPHIKPEDFQGEIDLLKEEWPYQMST